MNVLVKVGIGIAVGLGSLAVAYFFQNKTNNIHRESTDSGNPRLSACCFCLKDFSNFKNKLKLPCTHLIHKECAQNLFKQGRNICPRCLKEVSKMFLLTSGVLKSY